jgi:hypothetical protein
VRQAGHGAIRGQEPGKGEGFCPVFKPFFTGITPWEVIFCPIRRRNKKPLDK